MKHTMLRAGLVLAAIALLVGGSARGTYVYEATVPGGVVIELPTPGISVSATALDFGAVSPGQSKELLFTITNLGDADLDRLVITTEAPLPPGVNYHYEYGPGPIARDQQWQVRLQLTIGPNAPLGAVPIVWRFRAE